jgi:hypothetical protein
LEDDGRGRQVGRHGIVVDVVVVTVEHILILSFSEELLPFGTVEWWEHRSLIIIHVDR